MILLVILLHILQLDPALAVLTAVQEANSSQNGGHCFLGSRIEATPPSAPQKVHWTTTAAGNRLDLYHWLRDDSRANHEVLAYLQAENEYSSSVLQQLQPLQQSLLSEMEGRMLEEGETVAARHGSWWYYERSEPSKRHWVTYRRQAFWKQLQAKDVPAPGTAEHVQQQQTTAAEHDPFSGAADMELAPDLDAPEQLVLDPNAECAAYGLGTDTCEVMGRRLSPDGGMVAYGLDLDGTESYRLLVRRISDGVSMLDAVVDGTSGEYEWAADSRGLYYITREPGTNRPSKVWYYRMGDDLSAAVLLWHEMDAAFYLSLSCTSSGRYLVLSAASEVTRESMALDLLALGPPSPDNWIRVGQRQHGVQQQLNHWQDWFLLLTATVDTPNAELHAAHVYDPRVKKVLLPHRPEVEMEDVRVYQHHLVVVERQLGHVALTIYCLPANSTSSAVKRCRHAARLPFLTTAAAAAAQQEEQAPLPQAQQQQQEAGGQAAQGLDFQAEIEEMKQQLQQQQQGSGPMQPAEPRTRRLSGRRLESHHPAANLVQAGLLMAAEAQQVLLMRDRMAAQPGAAVSGASAAVGAAGDAAGASSTALSAVSAAAQAPEVVSGAARRLLQVPSLSVSVSHRALQQRAHSAFPGHGSGRRAHHGGPGHHHHPGSHHAELRKRRNGVAAGGRLYGLRDQSGPVPPVLFGSSAAAEAERAAASSDNGNLHQLPELYEAPVGGHGSSSASTDSNSSSSSIESGSSSSQRLTDRYPVLLKENSWQVAFEEDSYSVSVVDSGSWSNPVLRVRYSSFAVPHTIVDVHLDTQRQSLRTQRKVGGGFSAAAYRSHRMWAKAEDGTQVPISLVYCLSTLQRHEPKPALLMAYGAYGTKFEPEFDSRLFSLVDRGWVVGIAHVRGGGELGRSWHAQGKLEHKPNSFRDLIACAKALIDAGLTSSDRLAVWGRSAGGLTVGAALNVAPHLFRSAVMEVPFLDVLHDLVDASLPLTVKDWEEWGNPVANATMAHLIASYSPVEGIQPQQYPHVFVSAALNDRRVNYWEPAKWTAKLRATKTSDSLLLLQTDMAGGHFVGSARSGSLDAAAWQYAFLLSTMAPCEVAAAMASPVDTAYQHAAAWALQHPMLLAGAGLLVLGSLAGAAVVLLHLQQRMGYSMLPTDASGPAPVLDWSRAPAGASPGSPQASCDMATCWPAAGAGKGGVAAELAVVAQLEVGMSPGPAQKVRASPVGSSALDSGLSLDDPGMLGRQASLGKPPLHPNSKKLARLSSHSGRRGTSQALERRGSMPVAH